MLQQADTNKTPPQFFATAARANLDTPQSALHIIQSDIQPIEDCPDLLDKLCYLSEENNVAAVIALYDAYAAMAGGILLLQNQTRAKDVDDFLEAERCQAWAKAYLAADFLKNMCPDHYQAEPFARVLFDCAIQMGSNLFEAAALVQEISERFASNEAQCASTY